MRDGSVIAERGFSWCEGVCVMGQCSCFVALVWQVTRGDTSVTCKHLWRGNWHSSCFSLLLMFCISWVMNTTCIPILTNTHLLLPHFHLLHKFLGLFPPLQRGSASHPVGLQQSTERRTWGSFWKQHCLKCWVRCLGRREVQFACTSGIQDKALHKPTICSKKHLLRTWVLAALLGPWAWAMIWCSQRGRAEVCNSNLKQRIDLPVTSAVLKTLWSLKSRLSCGHSYSLSTYFSCQINRD